MPVGRFGVQPPPEELELLLELLAELSLEDEELEPEGEELELFNDDEELELLGDEDELELDDDGLELLNSLLLDVEESLLDELLDESQLLEEELEGLEDE